MQKTAEIEELKEKDKKILFNELKEAQKKLSELKFSLAFRKLKNYHEITKIKKRIARIWTILAEKSYEEIEKDTLKFKEAK